MVQMMDGESGEKVEDEIENVIYEQENEWYKADKVHVGLRHGGRGRSD